MTKRPADLRLLAAFLGTDPTDYLAGRPLLWARRIGRVNAWESGDWEYESLVVIRAEVEPRIGAVHYDTRLARLAVELLTRCQNPLLVARAAHPEVTSRGVGPGRTLPVLLGALRASDFVDDSCLLMILERLALQWDGSLAELLVVARTVNSHPR